MDDLKNELEKMRLEYSSKNTDNFTLSSYSYIRSLK